MPLLAILVVPVPVQGDRGVASVLLALAAGVIAFACTTVASYLIEPSAEQPTKRSETSHKGRIPISTRMALQMLTALVLAFTTGMLVLREHWPWVVLTAFIVTSGAVARGDAIYKGLLRFGGAVAGTLAAALVALVTLPNGTAYAALIFAVLFVGIWLRQINYAYWAICATLIFALLQGTHGSSALTLFSMRLAGIAIGAVCGIVATWFVYPIRTEQIVRRRVADALAALKDVVVTSSQGHIEREERLAALEAHAQELHRVAPPARLHRVVFGPKGSDDHPAGWIEIMHHLFEEVRKPDFDRAHVASEMRRLGAMLRKDSG